MKVLNSMSTPHRYNPNAIDVRMTTTVVVILVSIFFGVYLFVLDLAFNNIVQWIFRRFGAA